MSSQRKLRKERQIAKIQPKAVCINRKIYDIADIPKELVDQGHIFKIKDNHVVIIEDENITT